VQLSELRLTVERLSRDKASLRAELAGLKEELELCSFSSGKSISEWAYLSNQYGLVLIQQTGAALHR
jgi:hypothetical protein